jgi:hypothetical protein
MTTPKLIRACYVVRRTKPYLSWGTLKIIYYAFYHSIMTYGLIFRGNSTHHDCILKLQKRIIIIIHRAQTRDPFKLLLLLLFIANGFVPSGSSTTVHKRKKKHKMTHTLKTIHNTQNYKHNKVHVPCTLKTQNGNFNLTKNLK